MLSAELRRRAVDGAEFSEKLDSQYGNICTSFRPLVCNPLVGTNTVTSSYLVSWPRAYAVGSIRSDEPHP